MEGLDNSNRPLYAEILDKLLQLVALLFIGPLLKITGPIKKLSILRLIMCVVVGIFRIF